MHKLLNWVKKDYIIICYYWYYNILNYDTIIGASFKILSNIINLKSMIRKS